MLNASALPARVQLVFLLLSFVYLAVALYASYVTNCVVVGQCNVLSWVFVALYLVYAVTAPLYLSNTLANVKAILKR